MASKQDVIAVARNYLRDFPQFFQIDFQPAGRTYNLGKPNVDPDSLWIAYVPNSGGASPTVITDYSLNERQGIVRLANVPPADSTVMIEGMYYEWLTAADLDFYAEMAINYMTFNIKTKLSAMNSAVVDVVGIRALVEALMGLLGEYSRDIDVLTSEGVQIIASQRYRMVSDLLSHWTEEYNKRAGALNIGLDRVEVYTLRRVSRTTNRLIPVYKHREMGDYGPIERVYPPIDDGFVDLEKDDDELRQDVYVEGDPPPGYVTGVGYY